MTGCLGRSPAAATLSWAALGAPAAGRHLRANPAQQRRDWGETMAQTSPTAPRREGVVYRVGAQGLHLLRAPRFQEERLRGSQV